MLISSARKHIFGSKCNTERWSTGKGRAEWRWQRKKRYNNIVSHEFLRIHST